MSSVSPSAGQSADKFKVVVAALLVIAGVAGYYYLSASPTVVADFPMAVWPRRA